MSKLRICILPYRPSASGASSYTVELAKSLSFMAIEVILVGCELEKLNLANKNIEFIDCGLDPVLFQFAGGPLVDHIILSYKLKKIIKDKNIKVDVLHFTLPSSSIFFNNYFITTAWLPLGTFNMVKLHPKLLKFPKNFLANFALFEYNIMELNSFRKAAKILCLTTSTYEKFRKTYPSKVVLIPPPIDVRIDSKRIHHSLKPNILFIARDLSYPRKNLKTLLLALIYLTLKGVKNFKLTLVGDNLGPLSMLVNKLKKAGIEITHHPRMPRQELLKKYEEADIFVSPNIYEELGHVTLEALGAGLPIIASDIPPFRDLVKEGINGYLVPALDYKGFAIRINELIEHVDLRRKMSEASLRYASQNFSYEVVGKKLMDLYENLDAQ